MAALAVNVVTPERVGMATEIFNTVRVSADGVAIAIISALLAAHEHVAENFGAEPFVRRPPTQNIRTEENQINDPAN
ncbi:MULTISPECIES: hypothetical protein [Pectobacterium]|uniref:hypothetical protein n=1 Tax=Pectobacterium TaxID=122277 RepID=UPI001AD7A4FA|nr:MULTISPECIES: hypothetical protein [Pectobacterium]GKX44732.1 hypothetical protein SOASR015_37660 [Pectobacterium carotovorum subsp. carotovorum]GLX58583.1 hypothetical protein Pcaca02_38920 [Pectobacterium carotovorum subsp. carotovorum]